jgi:beta-glucosidase
MELISTPTDFFGLNYYQSSFVRADDSYPLGCVCCRPEGRVFTAMDWAVCPDGFYEILMESWQKYRKKILVTENGAAFADTVSEDGYVHDTQRLAFYREHLKALYAALSDGADIRGYLAWSSFDNFEWACGYERRFGMTYVDYPTQKRIIKDSGKWYADTILNNGFEIE